MKQKKEIEKGARQKKTINESYQLHKIESYPRDETNKKRYVFGHVSINVYIYIQELSFKVFFFHFIAKT